MIEYIAKNELSGRHLFVSGDKFIEIDSNTVDVVGIHDTLSDLSLKSRWSFSVSNEDISDAWRDLIVAATTSLAVTNTKELDSRKKILRVPDNLVGTIDTLSSKVVTLDKVHELSQRDDLSSEAQGWVSKVVKSYPRADETKIDWFNADLTYFGRTLWEGSSEISQLFATDGQTWFRREENRWVTSDEPTGLIVDLDHHSALAAQTLFDFTETTSVDFANVYPEEFGLYIAAEADLDFDLIDEVSSQFDIYDSQERSINAQKQVRGPGGRFTPAPKTSTPTPEAPVARLPMSLPLVPNISERISQYLDEVTSQRDEDVVAEEDDELAIKASNSGVDETDVRPLYVAIVDNIDPDAVLDVLALVPPKAGATATDVTAWRRKAGQWETAPEMLAALRGSTPPPVVELSDDSTLTAILEQVDKATAVDQEEGVVPGETEVTPEGDIVENNELEKINPLAASASDVEALVREYSITADPETKERAIQLAIDLRLENNGQAPYATDLLPYSWRASTSPELGARGYSLRDGAFLVKHESDLEAMIGYAETFAAREHLTRRAKALNRQDLIPSDWIRESPSEDFWGPNGEIFAVTAAGGIDRNRGNAERLRRYWTRGAGAAKIRWGTGGDWTRCVANLSKYLGPRAKGYCALRHKEMNGYWPGDKRNK